MKTLKITVNLFLGIIMILTALILAGHLSLIKGFKFFVVQSGSMEPAIKLGSIIMVSPKTFYDKNDIVTFSQNSNLKSVVTHRIALVNLNSYQTKGDANENLDQLEVTQSDIIGKVYLTIPYLGYAVDFAKTPKGFILLVIIPASILIYEEIRKVLYEVRNFFKKKVADPFKKDQQPLYLTPKREFIAPKALIVIPTLGILFFAAAVSSAFLMDQEVSIKNVMRANFFASKKQPDPPLISSLPSPVSSSSGDLND